MRPNIIQRWIDRHTSFVILDPRDSSVTLSRKLFNHLRKNCDTADPNVFMFKEGATNQYGFMLNPDIEQPTHYCKIQHNAKYKCIGFETLCPTVELILYTYAIPSRITKLSVRHKRLNGKSYYLILNPNKK